MFVDLMNNEILVSVVIPCYNCEKYIYETIQSVLNQTYKNIEIIVVNDGSTDKSKEIILSFKDDRIKYIYQENRGVASARNKGIMNASGKYIALLDSDDIFLKEKIAVQIEIAEKYNKDLIFTNAFIIDEKNGKILGSTSGFLFNDKKPLESLFKRNNLITSSALIRKKVFYEIGLFSVDPLLDGVTEDYEFWLRCAEAGYKFYKVNRPLIKYRITSDSLSANKIIMKKKEYYVLRKYSNSKKISKKIKNYAFSKCLKRMAIHSNSNEEAIYFLKKSISFKINIVSIFYLIIIYLFGYKILNKIVLFTRKIKIKIYFVLKNLNLKKV